MLPPLNLLALDTTLDTDLNTWQGMQGAEGAFSAAFTELLRLPAHATGALASLSTGQGASRQLPAGPGQPLPQGGNALPAPGLATTLHAETGALMDMVTFPGSAGSAPHVMPEPGVGVPEARPVPVLEKGLDLLPAPPVFTPVMAGTEPLPGAMSPAAVSALPATIFRDPSIIAPRTAGRETLAVALSGETPIASAEARSLPLPQLSMLTGEDGGIAPELVEQVRLKTATPATAFDLLVHAGSEADVLELKGTLPTGSLPTGAPAPSSPGFSTSAAQAATGAPLLVTSSIDLPPSDPEWGDALGDRVLWMAGNKVHNAELKLNPAELGPVRVQIQVDDGAATINFSAQHPLTRDALEQALPRLREMLAEQGIALGGASVTEQGAQRERSEGGGHATESAFFGGEGTTDVAGEAIEGALSLRSAAGLVDVFA